MKKYFPLVMAITAIFPIMMSCSKDDKDEPATNSVKRSITIKTSDYTKWTYFSFEKGDTVAVPANFKNDKTWDLALHRWDVRTNSGESGIGQGGAYAVAYSIKDVTEESTLASWSVPILSASFTKDSLIKTYMNIPNMYADSDADQRVDVPANTVLGSWMVVKMASIPPTYAMAENAFVVKTANGKYAVVQFTNYMNNKAEKGYVTFEYIYPVTIWN